MVSAFQVADPVEAAADGHRQRIVTLKIQEKECSWNRDLPVNPVPIIVNG